jgi:hypothetical protein
MRYLISSLLVLCPLAAFAQSPGAAKSVEDCENIKNDLVYNQCLASFGPKHGERRAGASHDDGDGPSRRTGRSARGGRQAATFNVVSGGRSSRKASAETPGSVRTGRKRR